jgi:hypothetical protein
MRRQEKCGGRKCRVAAALGSGLIFAAACAPGADSGRDAAPKEEAAGMTAFGPPRLSPKEFERFLAKARKGDIAAMHTLSVHHLSGSERAEAYDWLRRAARLGDCQAVVLLVEDDFDGVAPSEMPHWRNEQRRLGCDPQKNYGIGPTIKTDPAANSAR